MRYIGRLLGSIVLIPVIGLTVYFFMGFLPHQTVTTGILDSAPKMHRGAPIKNYEMAVIAETESGLRWTTARNLIGEADFQGRQIGRQFHQVAWTFLLPLSYSDEELFAIWCHYYWAKLPDGSIVRGLNKASVALHNRPLDELDTLQLASLIARIRAPSSYANQPDRVRQRAVKLRDAFLARHATPPQEI